MLTAEMKAHKGFFMFIKFSQSEKQNFFLFFSKAVVFYGFLKNDAISKCSLRFFSCRVPSLTNKFAVFEMNSIIIIKTNLLNTN